MNLGPLGDSTIATAQEWLHGLSRRQQAISTNIANIDTPGYHAQDVPFETEMRRALGGGSARLLTTDPRHMAVGASGGTGLGVQQAQLLTSQRQDGNDVDIDQEMVKLSETQMQYQAAASALSMKLETIRTVLRNS